MTDRARPSIAVVADDLIWSSRLTAAVERAGGVARPAPSGETLAGLLPEVAAVIVDLAGRSYDGVELVRAAASAGLPVVAAAQHDDLATRKAALAGGARRVYSYNKLFSDGPRLIAELIKAAA